MKNGLLCFFGFLFLFCACNKVAKASECADNPAENIAWLKALIAQENSTNSTAGLEVIQYSYKGNTVFSVNDCVNNCADAMLVFYDCNKEIVCQAGGITGANTCANFENEAVKQSVLFSSRNKATTIAFKRLKFQTSFGRCAGYCVNAIEFEADKLFFLAKDNRGALEPINCEVKLTNEQLSSIKNGLDVNQFVSMATTHGCPDCADGGKSLLEVELTSGEIKQVVFENGNPPKQLKKYADWLQQLLNTAKNDCEKK